MDSNNVNNNEQHVEPIANDVKGSVKWFHRNKGYGFVTRDDTKEDIFVHYSGIKPDGTTINKRQIKKRLNLMDNEKVSFDVVKNGNKLEARNVTGKNGSLILDLIAYKRGIRPMNLEIVNEQRLTGKVKWFNVKSKYGYIQCDYNNEDVYVNAKAITNNNPNKYKPSLHDGEAVEFDLMKRRDGKLEAVNVTGPNGNPVQGSEYSPDKTDKSSQPCVEAGLSGRVKWFNLKSGFGYITRNDNSQDIYVHYSSIKSKNPNHRLRSLNDGETVLFNLIESNRGPEAVDVTGPNGNPVQGSARVRPTRGGFDMRQSGPPNRGGLRRGPPPLPPNGMNMRNGRPPRAGNRPLPPPPPHQHQQEQQLQQQQGPPQNRRPRPPIGPNNLSRPPRTRNMNPNYMKNPYNNENLYNNDEPMYFTFKPKTKPSYSPFENANPRRIPFDKYVNQMSRPNNRGRGPPMQQQSPPMMRNGPPRNFQPPNMNNLVLVLERVSGKVKWYNFKRGYGFVTRYDNGQDIFVHQTGIRLPYNGMRPSLDDGETVEFDIYQDDSQLIAVNVTGPGGMNVKGSRYANSRSPIKTTVYRRRRAPNQPNQLH